VVVQEVQVAAAVQAVYALGLLYLFQLQQL
jgi:hypothetical protein